MPDRPSPSTALVPIATGPSRSSVRLLLHDADQSRLDALHAACGTQQGWDTIVTTEADHAVYLLESMAVDVVISAATMHRDPVLSHAQHHRPEVIRLALSASPDAASALHTVRLAHVCVLLPAPASAVVDAARQAIRVRALLHDDTMRDLVLRMSEVPSPPRVLQDLLEEMRRPMASVARVGMLAREDPALTAQLLRVVNSPLFGLHRPVHDTGLAVTLLGLDTVSAVLVQQHLFSAADDQLLERVGLGNLFAHCTRTARRAAALGRLFARTHEVVAMARAAGLLHDLGKLILALNFPNRYLLAQELAATGEVPLRVAETLLVGAPHDLVGGYLLALWGIPDGVVEAIAFHHDPGHGGAAASPVPALVHLANRLEHAQGPFSSIELDTDYLAAAGFAIDESRWQVLLTMDLT